MFLLGFIFACGGFILLGDGDVRELWDDFIFLSILAFNCMKGENIFCVSDGSVIKRCCLGGKYDAIIMDISVYRYVTLPIYTYIMTIPTYIGIVEALSPVISE